MSEYEFGGFWIRTLAALIDSLLLLIVIIPVSMALFGIDQPFKNKANYGTFDLIVNYLLPAFAVLIFWIYKSATPGKMLTRLSIIDAKTGKKPSTAQFIGRYLGYYLSALPLCLGLIWVGFDKQKQGWHDKLAGTLVIRKIK